MRNRLYNFVYVSYRSVIWFRATFTFSVIISFTNKEMTQGHFKTCNISVTYIGPIQILVVSDSLLRVTYAYFAIYYNNRSHLVL